MRADMSIQTEVCEDLRVITANIDQCLSMIDQHGLRRKCAFTAQGVKGAPRQGMESVTQVNEG